MSSGHREMENQSATLSPGARAFLPACPRQAGDLSGAPVGVQGPAGCRESGHQLPEAWGPSCWGLW